MWSILFHAQHFLVQLYESPLDSLCGLWEVQRQVGMEMLAFSSQLAEHELRVLAQGAHPPPGGVFRQRSSFPKASVMQWCYYGQLLKGCCTTEKSEHFSSFLLSFITSWAHSKPELAHLSPAVFHPGGAQGSSGEQGEERPRSGWDREVMLKELMCSGALCRVAGQPHT